MKIRKLEIRNFRGIASLDLDFTAPGKTEALDLVVLAGPNGCGKTSILEAVLMCLNRTGLLQERSVDRFNVRQGSNGFTLKVELQDKERERVVELRSNANGSYEISDRVWISEVAYFSSWRAPKLVGSVSITAGKPGRKPRATEENRLWRIKNYFVNLRARRAFQPESANMNTPSAEEQETLRRLSQTWRLFYPDRNDRFEALTASEKVEEGFDLFLLRANGDLRLPADSLSSGEIEVLTLLGSFLVDDFSRGIVVIDEPELHLHPAWHRVILQSIRSLLPNTQIISATHSTDILDAVASYERFVLLEESDPRVRMVKHHALEESAL